MASERMGSLVIQATGFMPQHSLGAKSLNASILTSGSIPSEVDESGSPNPPIHDPNNENWGNLALAIDPELLVGKEAFLRNVDRLMTHLKGLRRTDPASAISLPGEMANLRAREALALQEVEIDEDLFFAYRDKISLK